MKFLYITYSPNDMAKVIEKCVGNSDSHENHGFDKSLIYFEEKDFKKIQSKVKTLKKKGLLPKSLKVIIYRYPNEE